MVAANLRNSHCLNIPLVLRGNNITLSPQKDETLSMKTVIILEENLHIHLKNRNLFRLLSQIFVKIVVSKFIIFANFSFYIY